MGMTVDMMMRFKKKLIELIIVLVLLASLGVLKLYNNGLFFHQTHYTNSGSVNSALTSRRASAPSNATVDAKRHPSKPPLKIPWRFHIQDDGFVFPKLKNNQQQQFITYEPINRSLTRQLLQFENAVVFAYVLKRTLLVPPVIVLTENQTKSKVPMSTVIDFSLLATVVSLKEIPEPLDSNSTGDTYRTTYEVCQDPRLGFWVDFIPSLENINAWRMLKQQHFSPLKLRFNYQNHTQYWCPGTEKYFDRWGPPLQVKALYRGILTELYSRKEDVILFKSSTLDTTETRFFNRKRVRNVQEILLFYIRFAKQITKKIKLFSKVLGTNYTAILVSGVREQNMQGLSGFLIDNLSKLTNASKTLFIVSGASVPDKIFNTLRLQGYNLVFPADIFTQDSLVSHKQQNELSHIYALLLCVYAKHFIGLPGTPDLYFVQHLRLQDVSISDGLVSDRINVKWAKHTVKRKADDRKVMEKKSVAVNNSTVPKPKVNLVQNKELRLRTIACTFCTYVRYVTGKDGCPAMKNLCDKNMAVKGQN